jgi:D-alanyl-D-alanine carboxypeptidase
LKPGHSIAVEDAIKAVVTKSANDAAVAIAENLAGNEDAFAKLMTQKARALGMTRTTYVNASGLPDDDQVTTARDQALLGRTIQERFPRYYRYFSTEQFVYHGSAIRNHNRLLGEVGGVDGIKTGYTRASGFNLVTSVHRAGRYIVAVVLGGRSASERDARMRALISAHIREAALRRTAPRLTDQAEPHGETPPAASANAPTISPSPTPAVPAASELSTKLNAVVPGSNDPIHPVLVRTITYRTVPPPAGSLAPMPALVPVAPASPPNPARAMRTASMTASPQASAAESAGTIAAASSEPAAIARAGKREERGVDIAQADAGKSPARMHGRWSIQVGAFDNEDEAKQRLSAAKLKVPALLVAADPLTEHVQKGDRAFYRARFAGLDKATAEAACKLLKRNEVPCMALKD